MDRIRIVAIAALVAGSAFAADAGAQTLTTLHVFTGGTDGKHPYSFLTYQGGNLYGETTEGGSADLGTVFSVNAATGAETILHSFIGGADGATPGGGLAYSNGILYGTTRTGGAGCRRKTGCGAIFAINPASGAETIVHAFKAPSHGRNPNFQLIQKGGFLFGATGSVFFKIRISTGHETVICPSDFPGSSFAYHAGKFYGATIAGQGNGAVFVIDAATKSLTTLHNFQYGDGSAPYATPFYRQGTLYGTTWYGGQYDNGTVYSVNATTGAETTVYAFKGGTDAHNAMAVEYKAGQLWGISQGGGEHRYGTIFRVNPATGKERVVYSFSNQGDGGHPWSGMIHQYGTFYGITQTGGDPNGFGTVFKFTPRRD